MGLTLAGCETGPLPLEPASPSAPTPQPGPPGRIDGVAKFRTPEGRLVTCAGLTVALLVDTNQVRGRMRTLYGSDEHAVQPVAVVKARSVGVPGAAPPTATAMCDARGAFAFEEVAPGSYYLVARVKNPPPSRVRDDLGLAQHIGVRRGESLQVRLEP